MTNLHEFSKIHKYLTKIHVWFPLTIKKQNNLQRKFVTKLNKYIIHKKKIIYFL